MSFISTNDSRIPFSQSVSLLHSNNLRNFIYVKQLYNGDMEISSQNKSSYFEIELMRPSFCPFANLTTRQIHELNANETKKEITATCVVLVESLDRKVLLTKRASHLRTFPNVWVPPGGHVDQGESIKKAALRELLEETGLNASELIDKKSDNSPEVEENLLRYLCAWESAFPNSLNFGLPIRHSIVFYFLYQCLLNSQDIHVKLDPKEVSAYSWLDSAQVFPILQSFQDPLDLSEIQYSSEHDGRADETFICMHVVKESGNLVYEKESRPLSILSQQLTDGELYRERVSTGTKFALFHWMKQLSFDKP